MVEGKEETLYSKISYGKKVNKSIKKVTIGNSKCYTVINLHKTHRQFVMVIADKIECQSIHKNTCTFDTYVTDSVDPVKRKDLQNPIRSGYVVLMVGVLARPCETDCNKLFFNEFVEKIIKKCKPNIIAAPSYKHHGSSGACYAFGNKADYRMIEGVSVGTFTNVSVQNEMIQKAIDNESEVVKQMCDKVISNGVDLLKTIIPDIHHLVSPILDSANSIKTKSKSNIMKETATSSHGFWNTMLYVNGCTDGLHTEKDCTYTLITVPQQSFTISSKALREQPMFIFKLKDKQQLILPLVRGMTFVYNGRFMTHCQEYSRQVEDKGPPFFNISSYGNEKIFNHLRKTFSRVRK